MALNKTLRTAMTGVSKDRQELADTDISLEAVVTPLPLRGGETLVRTLFEPLGWNVDLTPAEGPGSATGSARYGRLKLTGVGRLSALLNHLYVLIPVMDDAKHYWVGEAEIDKLMAKGEGWLDGHPARDVIVRRYLRNRGALARVALERLAPETSDEALAPEARVAPEDALEAPIRLKRPADGRGGPSHPRDRRDRHRRPRLRRGQAALPAGAGTLGPAADRPRPRRP